MTVELVESDGLETDENKKVILETAIVSNNDVRFVMCMLHVLRC